MVGEVSAMTAERLKNSVCCLYADSGMTRIQAQLDDSRLGSGPRGRRFKSSRPDQLFPKTLAFLDRRGG
jgi:hypothetical protein